LVENIFEFFFSKLLFLAVNAINGNYLLLECLEIIIILMMIVVICHQSLKKIFKKILPSF